MAMFKLPYVTSFIDARGKLRHVFRRKGMRKVTIKGRAGSTEFMDAYAALLAQSDNAVAHAGASRTKPGTIDALAVKYLRSDHFTKGLALATQASRRRILDNFRACMTSSGRRYGENRLASMQRQDVVAALVGKTPAAQKDWLKVIRHFIAFAISEGDVKVDVTIGIKPPRAPKTSGFLPWGSEQIATYRAKHANGTMARLALELMLNIAARRHDACLIGRQHLRNGRLTWRPHKTSRATGKMLTIRVLPELQSALDAMPPSDALPFVLNDYGRPFASAAAFGNKFADWCKAAGLRPVVCDDGRVRSYRAHGLRKTACTQLAHASCTAPRSWRSVVTRREVQKYIAAVEQERMAEAAMAKRSANVAKIAPAAQSSNEAVPNVSGGGA